MDWRFARLEDAAELAGMNARLIEDEGHRNPMTLAALEARMRSWLGSGGYRAVLFELGSRPVAYALYRLEPDGIHLRQFFVERSERRRGLGRAALSVLRQEVWPADARITLEVLVGNRSAAAFWRAVGFRDYAVVLELPSSGPA